MGTPRRELGVEELRWNLDLGLLNFETTNQLEPLTEIIGQPRGLEAFQFGMGMEGKGYNIFVTGSPEIGTMSMVEKLLAQYSHKKGTPDDLCYVYNFKTPDEPILLRFPAGQGPRFKSAVTAFVEDIKKEITHVFESQEYLANKNRILESHEKKVRDFYKALEAKVKDAGFAMINLQVGQIQRPDIAPIIDDRPVPMFELEERVDRGHFPKEEFESLSSKYRDLKEELENIFLEIRDVQKDVKQRGEEVDRMMFMETAGKLAADLDEFANKDDEVKHYVQAMLADMAQNLDKIRSASSGSADSPMAGLLGVSSSEAVFSPYQVNLLVDNSERVGPPVIVETNPTYRNLFGSIERLMDRGGMWRTDFTKITAGSFIKANGGYLVINLMDAIGEPGVWKTLKRSLKTSEIEIQTFDPFYLISGAGIKPESISMEVKVVVLAEPWLYAMLQSFDHDLSKIFKVRADLSPDMDKNEQSIMQVAGFVRRYTEEKKLRPLDRGAVAALVEHEVRLTGRKEKLSTAFTLAADLLEEADHLAALDQADQVRAEHVKKALQARIYRASMLEERFHEYVNRGSVIMDLSGEKVGQINGLAVYFIGGHAFGRPSRITASTSMGRDGLINIEREADMAGSIHNKGMLILAGWLRAKFAQNKPLSLYASIAFEQSYSGVDGDSASSTELYALLSSLSDLPIRQGIAVTGSVSQKGEIQPIGGVNEKIEGFFQCCKKAGKGLTGSQGVMIPEANVADLMLHEEVVEAVRQGLFHIYAVKTIEDGIEILTGHPAGSPDAKGQYPKGSVYGRVDGKLSALAEGLRDFGSDKADKKAAPKKAQKPKTPPKPE